MSADQLKAEITVVYKRELSDQLNLQMAKFFPNQGTDAVALAAKTTMAGMTRSLALAVFARDMDKIVFLYLKEDTQSLKVHVESLQATTLKKQQSDVERFHKVALSEVERLERFSKKNKYKISTINVVVSMHEASVSKGEQKLFLHRLGDGLKAASVIGKVSGVTATGLVAFVLQMDVATGGKLFLASVFAIAISAVVEAAFGDAFKFQRS
jgi:hypothetical protein